MSTQIDWGDLQPESIKEERAIDWGDIKPESPKKQFPWIGHGKVHGAYKALREHPDLLQSVFPKAAEQLGQSAETMQNPITSMLKSLISPGDESFSGERQTPGKIISEKWMGEGGIPQHLKQGAQDIADLEEFIMGLAPIPGIEKPPLQGAFPRTLKGKATRIPETFPSGLTKPRAVEAKRPHLGKISPERQKETIGRMDQEAQKLFKGRFEESMPLAKQIREGVDFSAKHRAEFGPLKAMAEKANPQINISPLRNFLLDTVEEYKGIPSLHLQAKKIVREISAFRKRPESGLGNLLKIYRSNGQKLKDIYEKRILEGKQSEYSDFLTDMNSAIVDSIKETLPPESQWLKEFLRTNKEYSDYIKTLKASSELQGVLGEKINTASLTKIADDPFKQKKLKLYMGEEEAKEIIQIARDLKKARQAIKNIPARKVSQYEALWPITFLFKPVGVATALYKGAEGMRRFYGYLLTRPAKRKAFSEMVDALAKDDLKAYSKATEKLEETVAPKLLEYKKD